MEAGEPAFASFVVGKSKVGVEGVVELLKGGDVVQDHVVEGDGVGVGVWDDISWGYGGHVLTHECLVLNQRDWYSVLFQVHFTQRLGVLSTASSDD